MHDSSLGVSAIKKQHVAALLAALALLSYIAGIELDRGTSQDKNIVGIVTALAKDDLSGYEMFLKVDGIDGDAADTKHRAEIVVDSFAWNEARDRGAPKAGMNGFTVTMPASSASAKMFLFGASGTKMSRVVLSVRKSSGAQDILKWILTDTQITSFQTVGNTHGDGVSDKVTFGFGKIEFEYRQLMPDGSYAAPVKSGWDQRLGKSVAY